METSGEWAADSKEWIRGEDLGVGEGEIPPSPSWWTSRRRRRQKLKLGTRHDNTLPTTVTFAK